MKIRAAMLGLLLSLSFGSVASAQERAACEVLMIHGLREGPGIDQSLSQLRQLREAPFSPSYTTFKLLRRARLPLVVGTPQSLELPTGRSLRLSYLGRSGQEERLRFQVSITRPGRRDYLPAVQYVTQRGEPFFQAGQTHEAGVLILAFICR
jgi:hypothetical protein